MLKNFRAFTLIEIIVVLIIIGILATLSLNAYFNWIERSKTSEAFSTLKQITDLMDGCIAKGNSSYDCFLQIVPGGNMSSFDTTYFKYHFDRLDYSLPFFSLS